jgi:ATP-dependent RNA helicase DeaD
LAIQTLPEAPDASFSDLPISEPLYRAIAELGWETPTPIQALALPSLLEGGDVVGLAQTGSGKTGAFGIPLVEGIDPRERAVQALVLVPTRELAMQVAAEINALSRYRPVRSVIVCGGMPMNPQVQALRGRAQVVVGTPGRILDHLGQGTLRLDRVRYLVLDEADRMLDMGFAPDVSRILAQTPAESRQTALFSATMPDQIRRLVDRYMREPEWLAVESAAPTVDTVEQVYYHVADRDKTAGLRALLDAERDPLALVFRRTTYGTEKLGRQLERAGYRVGVLHGRMTQNQRNRTLAAFRNGHIRVLVATNVASRGLDINDVSHVINYDIPEDAETYIHRIGRTARAGKGGVAMTLVGESDVRDFDAIRRRLPVAVREARLSIYA